jgi:tetratricopeptide (TPR) repeat protein
MGSDPFSQRREKASDPYRALLDSGWQELRYANWPKAREILQQARDTCPRREDKAEAIFALANLWQVRQPGTDATLAQALYEQVVRDYADTPAAPWAHLTLARLADTPEYEKNRQVDRARGLYEIILKVYPEHPVADEAALRLAMTYLEKVGDRPAEDRGVYLLEKHLAARPTNYLASVMHYLLGDLAQRRLDWRRAVEQWIAADAKGGVTNLAERAALYNRIAHAAEHHLKDYALAAKWWERIVTDIQRDNRYYIAKLSAERCRKLAGLPPADASPPPGEGARPDKPAVAHPPAAPFRPPAARREEGRP